MYFDKAEKDIEEMKYQDKSEKTARLILQKYIEFVTSDMEDSIEAIILVGSLVTKSYVPGSSDIDQITILKDSAPPQKH